MQAIVKCTFILTIILLFGHANVGHAMPPFFQKFQDLYAGPKSPPGYPDKVTKAKCNVCHVEGEKKNVNNEYGKALQKAGLSKQVAKDLKDPVKMAQAIKDMEKAFDDAAKEKNSKDESFGDRIKDGKLPGG
jgi:hypothetical protein